MSDLKFTQTVCSCCPVRAHVGHMSTCVHTEVNCSSESQTNEHNLILIDLTNTQTVTPLWSLICTFRWFVWWVKPLTSCHSHSGGIYVYIFVEWRWNDCLHYYLLQNATRGCSVWSESVYREWILFLLHLGQTGCSSALSCWQHDMKGKVWKTAHLLSLKSGEKISFPGWSTDLHIRPNIRISSQQHLSRWIWSAKLSSTKPEAVMQQQKKKFKLNEKTHWTYQMSHFSILITKAINMKCETF